MYNTIVVAIDGSSTSARALDEAIALAGVCDARLRVLHIVDPNRRITGFERPEVFVREILPSLLREGHEILAQARAKAEAASVEVDTDLIENTGDPVWKLIIDDATANGAGLIVVGTHGRRGVNRVLMGSDAEQVARNSPVPVLLARRPPENA